MTIARWILRTLLTTLKKTLRRTELKNTRRIKTNRASPGLNSDLPAILLRLLLPQHWLLQLLARKPSLSPLQPRPPSTLLPPLPRHQLLFLSLPLPPSLLPLLFLPLLLLLLLPHLPERQPYHPPPLHRLWSSLTKTLQAYHHHPPSTLSPTSPLLLPRPLPPQKPPPQLLPQQQRLYLLLRLHQFHCPSQ